MTILNVEWPGTMYNKLCKMLAMATNGDGWMLEENCRSLGTIALVTKEWLLWPEDDYIGGLRNIGRRWHCDKACDWVDQFHTVWVQKEWVTGLVMRLWSLKWENRAQDWNLCEKKSVEKFSILRKRMSRQWWSNVVNT